MDEKFKRNLRLGYSTGTCASAAASAATQTLFKQQGVDVVVVSLPNDKKAVLEVSEVEFSPDFAKCSVLKDAGDDVDVTNRATICAEVRKEKDAGIKISGGVGVGTVTKKGLAVEPGEPAINPVPRQMIIQNVMDVCDDLGFDYKKKGLRVTISVPNGVELAKRTLNPQLGIVDGISILGTTGIVRPMSRDAFSDSLRLELRMGLQGVDGPIALVPGSYGFRFASGLGIPEKKIFKASNFIGTILDEAATVMQEGQKALIIGDLGKLVKVAGGIFSTHSSDADARMEIIAANSALCGADNGVIKEIMDCPTTSAALDVLDQAGLSDKVGARLAGRVKERCEDRVQGKLAIEVIIFSGARGIVGETKGARQALEEIGG